MAKKTTARPKRTAGGPPPTESGATGTYVFNPKLNRVVKVSNAIPGVASHAGRGSSDFSGDSGSDLGDSDFGGSGSDSGDSDFGGSDSDFGGSGGCGKPECGPGSCAAPDFDSDD